MWTATPRSLPSITSDSRYGSRAYLDAEAANAGSDLGGAPDGSRGAVKSGEISVTVDYVDEKQPFCDADPMPPIMSRLATAAQGALRRQ
jgi:hypothetical protein